MAIDPTVYVLSLGTLLFVSFFLFSCTTNKESSVKHGSSVKFEQYYLQGEQLYQSHCSNCHQKTGKGLGLLYPPLDRSDFMESHFKDVICLIDKGRKGELIVNGKNFNKIMPALPALTDLEIAEIATYIYNTWSHQRDLVDVKEVTAILSQCKEID